MAVVPCRGVLPAFGSIGDRHFATCASSDRGQTTCGQRNDREVLEPVSCVVARQVTASTIVETSIEATTSMDSSDPPTIQDAERAVTLPRALPARAGMIVADDPTSLSDVYALGEVIGRGGAGEVLLAHDRRIGRDVALKRLLTAAPTEEESARFLREARIQARLEHPAIVPVYELARDATGRSYFAMKRLAGTTLAQLLTNDRVPQRLLRAFAEICRAVDFSHSRGVVHRDLKPSNVVLGEFGEVYILDWGIARVVDRATGIVTADIDTLEGAGPRDHVLGTPGYMAPEQLVDPAVGTAADVYSLGAILFEILVGQPLHPRGPAAIASTRSGTTDTSPARRDPDHAIAPELDAACVAALAADPASRPPARALGDRIQDYLDGDRDLERRRVLAATYLAQARAVARDPRSHVVALRIAGRALSIDPESKDASAMVTSLLLAPPRGHEPELEARFAAVDTAHSVRSARVATYSLLAFFAFAPLLLWSGFTTPSLAIGTYVVVAALVAFIYKFGGAGRRSVYVALVGVAIVAAISSRLIGPFIIGPGVIGIMAMGLLAQPELMRRAVLVLAILVSAFLVPVALEAIGVLAPTWSVTDGSVLSGSAVIHLGGAPTTVILLVGNIATIVITGLFSRELAATRRDAQRSVEVHAWRLEQLVPVEGRTRLTTGAPSAATVLRRSPRTCDASDSR
jgi:serine/threonine protein kinase